LTVNRPFAFGWTWNYGEQLTANGNGWTLTFKDDTQFCFDAAATTTFAA
jgi:hypothetical protein